jgi:type VI secretion system protein ImpK
MHEAKPASPQPSSEPAPPDREGARWTPPSGRLTAAATDLLLAVQLIALGRGVADVGVLQARLRESLDRFRKDAEQLDLDADQVDSAHYALCALLDETLLSSDWGAGMWGPFSLLRHYYGEPFGGGRVFRDLESRLSAPSASGDLMELLYLCLLLGFRGRFQEQGLAAARVELLRRALERRLLSQAPGADTAPVPPVEDRMQDCYPPPRRLAPVWLIGALAGLSAMALYYGFQGIADLAAEPIATELRLIASEPTRR